MLPVCRQPEAKAKPSTEAPPEKAPQRQEALPAALPSVGGGGASWTGRGWARGCRAEAGSITEAEVRPTSCRDLRCT